MYEFDVVWTDLDLQMWHNDHWVHINRLGLQGWSIVAVMPHVPANRNDRFRYEILMQRRAQPERSGGQQQQKGGQS